MNLIKQNLPKPKSARIKKRVKKTKMMEIGTKKYIDPKTGEEIEVTLIRKNVHKDYNFHKIWLQDLLNILNSFGNKKIKILSYLLSIMRNEDNTVSVTYREIEEAIGVNKMTISATIRELIEANVLKKLKPATYQFNPAIIVKGNSGKRQMLLVEYYHTNNSKKIEDFYEPKELEKDLREEE